jgi:hypothetical protein
MGSVDEENVEPDNGLGQNSDRTVINKAEKCR